jgi:hypothetical protein
MGNLGEYLYLRLVISGEFWHLHKSARHGESFWNMYEYVVFFGPSLAQMSGMAKRSEL